MVVEARVQVAQTRFRVPDVCVLAAGLERERIIRHAPLLCIEVLSPRDRLNAMRKRVQEFLDMGVAEVWIFDPETRTAYVCSGDLATPITEHHSGTLRLAGTSIEIAVEAVFATLDPACVLWRVQSLVGGYPLLAGNLVHRCSNLIAIGRLKCLQLRLVQAQER